MAVTQTKLTAEKEILKNAQRFLNEVAISQAKQQRVNTGRKIKGRRKKVKEFESKEDIKQANELHAYEAVIGSVKMAVISYLRLECGAADIKKWIFGIEESYTRKFMNEIRVAICLDAVSVIKKDGVFQKPLAVHDWFFKSGFLKRSTIIFEELYRDGIEKYYSEDVLNLRDYYLLMAKPEALNCKKFKDFSENSGLIDEDDLKFKNVIFEYKYGLDLILKKLPDLADKNFIKKAKYLRTQVGTLCDIMADYILDISKELENSHKFVAYSKKIIAEREQIQKYQNSFGAFKEPLSLSCKMEGISFTKENEKCFNGYLRVLEAMEEKELRKEIFWLRGYVG